MVNVSLKLVGKLGRTINLESSLNKEFGADCAPSGFVSKNDWVIAFSLRMPYHIKINNQMKVDNRSWCNGWECQSSESNAWSSWSETLGTWLLLSALGSRLSLSALGSRSCFTALELPQKLTYQSTWKSRCEWWPVWFDGVSLGSLDGISLGSFDGVLLGCLDGLLDGISWKPTGKSRHWNRLTQWKCYAHAQPFGIHCTNNFHREWTHQLTERGGTLRCFVQIEQSTERWMTFCFWWCICAYSPPFRC